MAAQRSHSRSIASVAGDCRAAVRVGRVSKIWVLLPQIMTWGCAALLIRECVRRLGKGWPSMLLLGLALAIAVEWVILQTSIAPLVGPGERGYGRARE